MIKSKCYSRSQNAQNRWRKYTNEHFSMSMSIASLTKWNRLCARFIFILNLLLSIEKKRQQRKTLSVANYNNDLQLIYT